jgi:hypothetical protein
MKSILFAVWVVGSIIAFIKWYEYAKEKQLRDLVKWSAIGDYSPALGRYGYVRELLIVVLNAQFDDAIDKKYRITEESEKQYVIKIIEDYQKDIMHAYFKGQLTMIKSKYVIDRKDYFMFMLYAFLSDHQCDYDLTDFTVVFHKMHYITYMYCRRNEILRSLVPEWKEKNLKEILDTMQIEIPEG